MKPQSREASKDALRPAAKRKHLLMLLKVSLTVLLLAVLLQAVGWQALEDAVSRTNGSWLLALYAMTLLGLGVHAVRLQAVLRMVGLELQFWRVFLANALSAF